MKLGIVIEVESAAEVEELRRGLQNPTVRAFVRIMGTRPLRKEPPHELCGPRCFLEFIDALRRADEKRSDEKPDKRPLT